MDKGKKESPEGRGQPVLMGRARQTWQQGERKGRVADTEMRQALVRFVFYFLGSRRARRKRNPEKWLFYVDTMKPAHQKKKERTEPSYQLNPILTPQLQQFLEEKKGEGGGEISARAKTERHRRGRRYCPGSDYFHLPIHATGKEREEEKTRSELRLSRGGGREEKKEPGNRRGASLFKDLSLSGEGGEGKKKIKKGHRTSQFQHRRWKKEIASYLNSQFNSYNHPNLAGEGEGVREGESTTW